MPIRGFDQDLLGPGQRPTVGLLSNWIPAEILGVNVVGTRIVGLINELTKV